MGDGTGGGVGEEAACVGRKREIGKELPLVCYLVDTVTCPLLFIVLTGLDLQAN
jgi:hypothetical protein